tara:strand:- start:3485 stop:4171 length:687 start_codon:yes stop_codon:yes gene_type:complete
MNNIDKIFIIHYTKLEARKAHMLQQMDKWFPEIEHQFVEEFDQEDLSDEIINKNFDLDVFEKKFDREMLKSEMSLCMKYKKVINYIAESETDGNFFVLEDDVIFKEDPLSYTKRMVLFCNANKIDFDCIFLGEAWIRKGDNRDIFAKKEHPATNGLCTVLYNKKSVEKLNHNLKNSKITQPMDWELNDRFRDLDFQVYWGKAITEHGSVLALENGQYKDLKSTLRKSY